MPLRTVRPWLSPMDSNAVRLVRASHHPDEAKHRKSGGRFADGFQVGPAPSHSAGGFFFGSCRAQRMLTGEPFNPTFFGTARITSEPSSPSLLEVSLKVEGNNAHGGLPFRIAPTLQRVPLA